MLGKPLQRVGLSLRRPVSALGSAPFQRFRVSTVALEEAKKGWFYEAKLLFSSEARIARRERLQAEVTRGRFWELNQIRDNGGKLFECDQELIPIREAVSIPDLDGFLLNGKQTKLSDVLGGKTSLVTVCVRDMARPMIRGWTDPVVEKFGTNPAVQVVHLSFVEGHMYKLFKGLFISSLARAIPANQRDAAVVAFQDSEAFRTKLDMDNRLVALVLVVDPERRIRWRGVGYVSSHERKALLRCVASLLPR